MTGSKEPFSVKHRTAALRKLGSEQWDVLVIGGGITGAGIALDAASRGLRTGLVEMQDFAAGTSSRSTKLVHGGLRYLKQLEVKMVAEVGRERAVVYENGPHVTTPERMLLPIYKGGTFGKFSTSLGLAFYDFLADVKKSERRTMLTVEETAAKEPLLKREGLLGGGCYVEYRTDDARLTLEVMKKAAEYGAVLVNYAKAEAFLYDERGGLAGARIRDVLGSDAYEARAKVIVNACGPWVDRIREMDGSKKGKMLRLTKGVHLVFDAARFPLRQAVYFDVPDGRMVFAIPRDGKTYLGTTDTDYHDDLEHPRMTEQDRKYLIAAANGIFPSLMLTEADVESSWAGLRPLIYQEGKAPSEISRRDEIFVSDSGLVSIAGGKLTGYRKMAETVVDLVVKKLASKGVYPQSECRTKRMPISGGDVGGSEAYPAFISSKTAEGVKRGLARQDAERLVRLYGSNADRLFQLAESCREEAGQRNIPPYLLAALTYGMEEEMAATPADFLIRRTGALFFDMPLARKYSEAVIRFMADYLGWTEDETQAQRAHLKLRLKEAAGV